MYRFEVKLREHIAVQCCSCMYVQADSFAKLVPPAGVWSSNVPQPLSPVHWAVISAQHLIFQWHQKLISCAWIPLGVAGLQLRVPSLHGA